MGLDCQIIEGTLYVQCHLLFRIKTYIYIDVRQKCLQNFGFQRQYVLNPVVLVDALVIKSLHLQHSQC